MPNIVATIEARMTSSRLPGKVLLEADGKPMLWHLVNRLKQVKSIGKIVLATTDRSTDDVLMDFAGEVGILAFRGSEANVMSRVIGAAKFADADIIVEVTADCPLIDPLLIEQTIQVFLNNECDYVSNSHIRSYPIGMDTQVYKLSTLQRSYSMTQEPLDQEHVTRHIRLHPQLFRLITLAAPPDLHWPQLALTLDEKLDYELLKNIIEYFGAKNRCFSCRETIELLLNVHPEWVGLNRSVKRKGLHG